MFPPKIPGPQSKISKYMVYWSSAVILWHLCLHFACTLSLLHHAVGLGSKTVIRPFHFVSGHIPFLAFCRGGKPRVTHLSLQENCVCEIYSISFKQLASILNALLECKPPPPTWNCARSGYCLWSVFESCSGFYKFSAKSNPVFQRVSYLYFQHNLSDNSMEAVCMSFCFLNQLKS